MEDEDIPLLGDSFNILKTKKHPLTSVVTDRCEKMIPVNPESYHSKWQEMECGFGSGAVRLWLDIDAASRCQKAGCEFFHGNLRTLG